MDGIGVAQSPACLIVGPGTLTSLAFPVSPGEEIATFTADVWEIRNDCGAAGTEIPLPAPLPIIRITACDEPASSGVVRGDSVVAIDFSTTGADTDGDGIADQVFIPGSFEIHCDALVDASDDGVLDGSDSCTATDLYVPVAAKNTTDQFECDASIDGLGNLINHACTKYDGQICNHVDPARNDEDCTTTNRTYGCACIAPFANPLIVPPAATTATVTLGGSLALDPVEPIIFGLGISSPTSATAFDNVYVD